jgi:hypothetical protein
MNYISDFIISPIKNTVDLIPKPYFFEKEEKEDKDEKYIPINYKNFTLVNKSTTPIPTNKKRLFKHLEFANQSYFEHLKDSLYYSAISFKSAFFFAIHGFYPDIFTHSGSDNTVKLADSIVEKYANIINKEN